MSVTRQKSVQKEKVYLSHCVMRFKFLHSQSWLWQKSVQKEKFDLLHFVVRLCTPNADLDRNLFKKKNLSFTLCGEIFAHLDGNLCKKKKVDLFYTVWWDFAVPILTLTEICAKRKIWSLTLCGEILHSKCWPCTCGFPQLPAACLNTDDTSLWNRLTCFKIKMSLSSLVIFVCACVCGWI